MNKLQEYVFLNCSRELEEVKRSHIVNVKSQLSLEECTLIYKYSEDGYEHLNERLRISKGKDFSEFGILLDQTLAKLPNYEDITYRAIDLTDNEMLRYIDARRNNTTLVEYSFISASRSKTVAYQFGKTCQFRIFSRSGKNIEEFTKYGNHHPQSEQEVLFRPNLNFKVLEVIKQSEKTIVTLFEI